MIVSKVEKHPSDEGKYQSTFDSYGHGEGNGKSRAAVYKHFNKLSTQKLTKTEEVEEEDYTKTHQKEEVEEEDYTKTDQFSNISWLSDEELSEILPTIPKPIRALASGDVAGMTAAQRATQTQLINWGFMGIDRGLTHWGRGVTGHEEWGINRHPMDYEAMTGATQHLMDENGISINLNPTLVWATVMSAAYVPPVTYVARNSDKTRRKMFFKNIGSFLRNPIKALRRRRVQHERNNNRDTIQTE